MFSRVTIQPAGNLGPQAYSSRRGKILNRITKMHRLKKTAKTEHAKVAYEKEITHEITLLKRLNEQQKAEFVHDDDDDLKLMEEEVERGFEIVDMNS